MTPFNCILKYFLINTKIKEQIPSAFYYRNAVISFYLGSVAMSYVVLCDIIFFLKKKKILTY